MLYCGLSGVGVCLVNATAQQVRGHLADQGGVRESVSISLCTHTVNVCGCNAGSEKAHAGTRGVCNNTGGTPQDSTHSFHCIFTSLSLVCVTNIIKRVLIDLMR